MSNRRFSAIGKDQNHEQLNKAIKGDGGVKGLFNNSDALAKWMIAGPELSRIVQQFESSMWGSEDFELHHEEAFHRQRSFLNYVQSLISTFQKLENPFKDDGFHLYRLSSKEIIQTESVESMKNAFETGKVQFETFWTERVQGEKPLMDTLCKNKLVLFKNCLPVPKSKQKMQITSLKTDCNLLSRLYIGSTAREGNLEEFFSHENQATPPSISCMGDKI